MPTNVPITLGKAACFKKALYGLKQAPQMWYNTLSDWLQEEGYLRSEADRCVFWKGETYLYIQVDDIAILSPDLVSFVTAIANKFKTKTLGRPHCYWE